MQGVFKFNYLRPQKFLVKKRIKRSYRVARYVIYRQTIINPVDHLWTFVGAFIGIASIGYIQKSRFAETDNIYLIGSFGATAVLIFGATNSPLAQPRNLVGGHVVSAVIGVVSYK
jgi:CBS domain-containing membrane protein